MLSKIQFSILVFVSLLFFSATDEVFADIPAGLEQAKANIIYSIQKGNFDEATAQTQVLTADFAANASLPETLYAIAGEWAYRLDREEYAKAIYQQIIQNYPDNYLANKAKLDIAKLNVGAIIGVVDLNAAKQAIAQLITDFNDHPDLPEALYWLASRECDWRLEMIDEAKNIYQQIMQNYPDSASAGRAKLGIARAEVMSFILLNDYNQSKEAIDKLIADFSSHPDFPETLYWLAERYRWAREYSQAKNLYEQIIKSEPDSTPAFAGASLASKAKLGLSRADALSLVVSGDYKQLEESVNKMVVDFNDHPDLPETLFWIAQECEWMIKLEDANNIYQRVIDYFPGSFWADKATLGVSRVNVGADIEKGETTAAEPAIDELVVDFNGHPDMAWALYWIAKRYEGQGEFEKTKQLYNQIIKQYPDSKYAQLSEIDIPLLDVLSLLKSGETTEAIKVIDKLIVDFNDNPNLPKELFLTAEDYYSKAIKYENDGLTEQAKANYANSLFFWDKIRTELPDAEILTVQHSCYFVAVCNRKLGNHQKALKYYQEVVDKWPNYKYAWSAQSLIGLCYEKLLKSGAITESEAKPKIEQAYKAVVENYPDCSLVRNARYKLGHIYFDKRQWTDAAIHFELLLEEPNESSPLEQAYVLYDLGRTYEQMGKLGLATETYGKFIEIAEPNDERIKTVKAKLEDLKGRIK